jgi:phage tail sheath protein FI
MPEYLAPGVYIEEVSSGSQPIEGVSTSTCGFVGRTERGPGPPRLVTSWVDYVRWYGSYVDRVPGGSPLKYLPYAVRGFFDNSGQRVFITSVTASDAVAASANLDGGALVAEAIGRGAWGNNVLLRVMEASVATPGPTVDWFRLTLLYYRDGIPNPFVDPTDIDELGNPDRREPDVIEDYDNLSIIPTDSNFAQSVVNAASKLVKLTVTARPTDVDFPAAVLAGGSAGAADPVEDDYRGNPLDPIDKRTGLLGLSGIRDISILAIPDTVELPNLRSDILQQCEQQKDRFAVLSATFGEETGNIATLRPPQDSSYGAYYLPWIRVAAPHTPEGHLLVPSTGHVAGIYARVDVERGVHKAPANEVIRGIITRDLPGDAKPLRFIPSKREQDLLNPKNVNVHRDFRDAGRGLRVYGARTMSSIPEWKYINVRRLFIFLEQSIDRGTQWAVFEPNDEKLWASVRMSITGFLQTVWRSGALMGTKQEEAFFVKCDRTTMTQDDWDNGRLICLIGVAPVKPAEFVIFQIRQKTLLEK